MSTPLEDSLARLTERQRLRLEAQEAVLYSLVNAAQEAEAVLKTIAHDGGPDFDADAMAGAAAAAVEKLNAAIRQAREQGGAHVQSSVDA